jgi:hypothetical protein
LSSLQSNAGNAQIICDFTKIIGRHLEKDLPVADNLQRGGAIKQFRTTIRCSNQMHDVIGGSALTCRRASSLTLRTNMTAAC